MAYDYQVNTKHLYNICTTLYQRRRRWTDVVQMLYKCYVFTGYSECDLTPVMLGPEILLQTFFRQNKLPLKFIKWFVMYAWVHQIIIFYHNAYFTYIANFSSLKAGNYVSNYMFKYDWKIEISTSVTQGLLVSCLWRDLSENTRPIVVQCWYSVGDTEPAIGQRLVFAGSSANNCAS